MWFSIPILFLSLSISRQFEPAHAPLPPPLPDCSPLPPLSSPSPSPLPLPPPPPHLQTLFFYILLFTWLSCTLFSSSRASRSLNDCLSAFCLFYPCLRPFVRVAHALVHTNDVRTRCRYRFARYTPLDVVPMPISLANIDDGVGCRANQDTCAASSAPRSGSNKKEKKEENANSSRSLTGSRLAVGDNVVVSYEDGRVVALTTGKVTTLTADYITVRCSSAIPVIGPPPSGPQQPPAQPGTPAMKAPQPQLYVKHSP